MKFLERRLNFEAKWFSDHVVIFSKVSIYYLDKNSFQEYVSRLGFSVPHKAF